MKKSFLSNRNEKDILTFLFLSTLLLIAILSIFNVFRKAISIVGDKIEKQSQTTITKTNGLDNSIENNLSSDIPQESVVQKFKEELSNCVVSKSKLTALDNMQSYFLTGNIVSKQVIQGKDGWLFYDSSIKKDGIPSIEIYQGSYVLQEDVYDAIYESTSKLQAVLEKDGIRSIFLLCPNKERIYAEYMPDSIPKGEESNLTDLLAGFLQEKGVDAISVSDSFLAEKTMSSIEGPLYYKYDTHWNCLGAAVAIENILSYWKESYEPLSKTDIIIRDRTSGDLADMAGLDWYFSEKEYIFASDGGFCWGDYSDEQETGFSIYENPKSIGEKTVLIVGDSFRTAFVPVASHYYKKVIFIHRNNMTAAVFKQMMDENDIDDVILIYVERYLKDMSDSINMFAE